MLGVLKLKNYFWLCLQPALLVNDYFLQCNIFMKHKTFLRNTRKKLKHCVKNNRYDNLSRQKKRKENSHRSVVVSRLLHPKHESLAILL